MLAGVGLFLAYGLYNPIYLALASLPGFNLFRVPARWLALFSLGVAMLSALGAETLLRSAVASRWRAVPLRRAAGFAVVIVALMALAPLAARTPDQTPTLPAGADHLGRLGCRAGPRHGDSADSRQRAAAQ
ncbi:MAG: hypothetical protein IPK19_30180 [Chloroflexi bacterium]|nr:hypothetical protein [Chloroflexota bacterium]